jgi:L-iditol 2-dehydrogenase
MKAAFLHESKKIKIHDIPVPKYKPDEVLIKIITTGLCGSDLHYYNEGRLGDNIITEPHILGHESAGVVEEIGENVDSFKPGDRVTLEPGIPCQTCEYCLSGRYNLCEKLIFLGVPPYSGSFREYVSHKATFTHKLPDNISFEMGALIEPFSVGYHAVKKLNLGMGNSVLITGAGPIGIVCLLMAKAAGATELVVTDTDDFRLNKAKKMGATQVVNINKRSIDINSFDFAIEASGAESAYLTALQGIKKGGHVAFVGMTNKKIPMDINGLLRKEAQIVGIYRYVNSYQPVLKVVSKMNIKVEDIVTHRFSLDNLDEAMEIAGNINIEKLKILIYNNGLDTDNF